jgi:hypothetical protein
VTNKATASGVFDDPASSVATADASATVTGHNCTISLTKTPDITEVCQGSETVVTYTYVVTNNSNFFTWTGTLTDDKLGAINGTITLNPGESKTFTANTPISQTTTNTATASGTFDDPNITLATAQASATVTAKVCGQGCTPGFWKNHTDAWPAPYTTGQKLNTVFGPLPTLIGNKTFLEALSFSGGNNLNGARRTLMRIGVAALLNSVSVDYPLSEAQVIAQVNAALATNNRATILAKAAELDGYNNLDHSACPG